MSKKIKDCGGKVYVLFLTIGDTNDYSKTGISKIDERIHKIENVARALNYDDYSFRCLISASYGLRQILPEEQKIYRKNSIFRLTKKNI